MAMIAIAEHSQLREVPLEGRFFATVYLRSTLGHDAATCSVLALVACLNACMSITLSTGCFVSAVITVVIMTV